jgi:hypothetical protein
MPIIQFRPAKFKIASTQLAALKAGHRSPSAFVVHREQDRARSTGTEAVPMDVDSRRLALLQAIALVTRLADRADQVAAGLRALREPQAASLVARLAGDADQAAGALRDLLEPAPHRTDWYQVHRDMWVRYGDLGDLVAMTDHVTDRG